MATQKKTTTRKKAPAKPKKPEVTKRMLYLKPAHLEQFDKAGAVMNEKTSTKVALRAVAEYPALKDRIAELEKELATAKALMKSKNQVMINFKEALGELQIATTEVWEQREVKRYQETRGRYSWLDED